MKLFTELKSSKFIVCTADRNVIKQLGKKSEGVNQQVFFDGGDLMIGLIILLC